jgi:hypothetical protein
MKALKIAAVIFVYFFFLPYIIVALFGNLVRDVVLESINYFKNTSI